MKRLLEKNIIVEFLKRNKDKGKLKTESGKIKTRNINPPKF